mgnify:CR=1 FL=1
MEGLPPADHQLWGAELGRVVGDAVGPRTHNQTPGDQQAWGGGQGGVEPQKGRISAQNGAGGGGGRLKPGNCPLGRVKSPKNGLWVDLKLTFLALQG